MLPLATGLASLPVARALLAVTLLALTPDLLCANGAASSLFCVSAKNFFSLAVDCDRFRSLPAWTRFAYFCPSDLGLAFNAPAGLPPVFAFTV
jgi:hypothetical protein